MPADAEPAALALPAELTHRQARACLQGLLQALPATGDAPVQLDASALQRFDSSAVAVLLELRRVCQRAGRRLQLRGLPAGVASLAQLYGVSELLDLAAPH